MHHILSSRTDVLPDLAPGRSYRTDWLPRLHRAVPSTSLDKSLTGMINCQAVSYHKEVDCQDRAICYNMARRAVRSDRPFL
jgi:hypothetical protein